MSSYVIGDIQGCLKGLRGLLKEVNFNKKKDKIFLTGDIINRGPESLETIKFLQDLGEGSQTVLGNHDIHLLNVASGERKISANDTFYDILSSPNLVTIINWLRNQKLLIEKKDFVIIHAGLLPEWSLKKAVKLAKEVESVLRGNNWKDFSKNIYGKSPNKWNDYLTGWDRIRIIVNAMTRLRYLSKDGQIDFSFKGHPDNSPKGLYPWFKLYEKEKTLKKTVIFGHWSSLGKMVLENFICLDTGYVWGKKLTAIRLKDRKIYQFSN